MDQQPPQTQRAITTAIVSKIEKTMAGRASSDGGGLSILAAEAEGGGGSRDKALKNGSVGGKRKR